MLALIRFCENETKLDLIEEAFDVSDEERSTVLRLRIVFWTNALAEDTRLEKRNARRRCR